MSDEIWTVKYFKSVDVSTEVYLLKKKKMLTVHCRVQHPTPESCELAEYLVLSNFPDL